MDESEINGLLLLQKLSLSISPQILKQYEELEGHLYAIKSIVDQVIVEGKNNQLTEVYEHEALYLPLMNKIVQQYENESLSLNFSWLEILIFLLAIGLLLIEAKFILGL